MRRILLKFDNEIEIWNVYGCVFKIYRYRLYQWGLRVDNVNEIILLHEG